MYFTFVGGDWVDYFSIGQRIRARRRECLLSQEELAEKIGISTTHMSHIETANTKLSLQVLVDIAKALSVSTDELLFGRSSDQEAIAKQIFSLLSPLTETEQHIVLDLVQAASLSLRKYL